MRDQKYLSILFFDRMECLHDLKTPLFILASEHLIKCQETNTTTTAKLTQCLRNSYTQHKVSKIYLSSAKTFYGVLDTIIVDEEVKLVTYFYMSYNFV